MRNPSPTAMIAGMASGKKGKQCEEKIEDEGIGDAFRQKEGEA